MKNEWIAALGGMTYGIYVLTAAHQDKINCMIASWVSQVSYDPPLIMVAVHPHRYTHQLVSQSNRFALHVLLAEQKYFLKRFKGPDPAAKFLDIEWKKGRNGCPILKACAAYLECSLTDSFAPGNHTLFVGEVTHAVKIFDGPRLHTGLYAGVYLGKK
jgi:flavin reductase (DIM6/NTAB) family NADH-FMN oxidoreductase RutF